MKIHRLAIRDFGHLLQRQVMEDIDPSLVVLAGANRAGKTTFMNVIRYLGYDFPPPPTIPLPTVKYSIQAELKLDDGRRCVLERDGKSTPKIMGINDDNVAYEDVFGEVDGFTYHQVFTISLDELRRLPASIENRDKQRLQTVLLGAGLSDVAQLQGLLEEFDKTATELGGKYGKPEVGRFKDFTIEIQSAVQQRDAALNAIEDYRKLQQEDGRITTEIQSLQDELDELNCVRTRLIYLEYYFQEIEEYEAILHRINQPDAETLLQEFPEHKIDKINRYAEVYTPLVDSCRDARRRFKEVTSSEDIHVLKDALLRNSQNIRWWGKQRSGLENRIETYLSSYKSQDRGYEQIVQQVRELNHHWAEPSVLDRIDTDLLRLDAIRSGITQYRSQSERIDRLEEQKDSLLRDLDTKRHRIKEMEKPPDPIPKSATLISLLLFLCVGLAIYLAVDPVLGTGVITGGFIFTGAVLIARVLLTRVDRTEYRRVSQDIDRIKDELDQIRAEIDASNIKFDSANATLEEIRENLHLPDTISPEILDRYFRDIRDLKEKFSDWRLREEELKEEREAIIRDLSSVGEILQDLNIIGETQSDPLESRAEILQGIETAEHWLENAEEFSDLLSRQTALEDEIKELLWTDEGQLDLTSQSNSSDDIAQMLTRYQQQESEYNALQKKKERFENLFSILERGYTKDVEEAFRSLENWNHSKEFQETLERLIEERKQHISKKALNQQVIEAEESIQEVDNQIVTLRNRGREIKLELDELATSDKMNAAVKQIDYHRSRLEPLAREYAISRVAEYIMTRVRTRMLDTIKHELLASASNLFEELTAGDYTEIILPDDRLSDLDYTLQTSSGDQVDTTEILSRGTQQQLFLAVRVGRIKEIVPPLPVVLDDSLVNFDVQHRRQAARIVNELSKRNQVFVLTCHPEILEYIAEHNSNAQYWTIENGQIEKSEYSAAIYHLQNM